MGIKIEHISKKFSNATVLKNISLQIEKGEFVSLTGKSGSGKSTLLYLMSSLDFPSEGSITIDGFPLGSLSQRELHVFRNREMGFIFQFHYLLPEFTALENVLMPARKAGVLQEKEKFAKELFRRFDLEEKMNELPGRLSGGQQQRVAIVRAMIMKPSYLFADEPTGALDSTNGKIVMDIFRRINREEKTTVVLVTHDNEFASFATRRIVLVDGEIQSEFLQS